MQFVRIFIGLPDGIETVGPPPLLNEVAVLLPELVLTGEERLGAEEPPEPDEPEELLEPVEPLLLLELLPPLELPDFL